MTFLVRLIREARLNARVYTELKEDKAATWQAVIVVVAVALAHAILGVVYATRGNRDVFGWRPHRKSPVTYDAILRTLGFAALPGVLYAVGFLSEAIP